MKRTQTEDELAADWLLLPPEQKLLHRRRGYRATAKTDPLATELLTP